MIRQPRPLLVNGHEINTDKALERAAEASGYRIAPKVRVADVLLISGSGISNAEYTYALRSHFDWVVTEGDERKPEFAVEFDVSAYELRPGLPPEGLPRDQLQAKRVYPPGYLDNMRQTAREAGIDMKRPPLVPNTRKAHEATEFAKEAGRLLPFHRALFQAYFRDEQNIGDVEVLCRSGTECGLDAAGLRGALDDGRFAAEVEEQIEWSRAVGITGVPTFIFDEKFSLVGAQDYEVFRDVAHRIVARRVRAGS